MKNRPMHILFPTIKLNLVLYGTIRYVKVTAELHRNNVSLFDQTNKHFVTPELRGLSPALIFTLLKNKKKVSLPTRKDLVLVLRP